MNLLTHPDAEAIDRAVVGVRQVFEETPGAVFDFYTVFTTQTPDRTQAGFAGWFALSQKLPGPMKYREAAEVFASYVGVADSRALENWAQSYPGIWGNKQGEFMFASESAYWKDFAVCKRLDLETFLDHWSDVAERIRRLPGN